MALDENTPRPLEAVGGYPRLPNGRIDPTRLIGELCRDLNTLGESIEACRAHLWYLDEITPTRGEQRDELEGLYRHIQWMHDAFCDADERLVNAYRIIEQRQRVPNPQ